MWVVCVDVCACMCTYVVVSKQEGFEMMHYKDWNPDSLVVSIWVGFILLVFLSSSLQSPKLITPLFFLKKIFWSGTPQT